MNILLWSFIIGCLLYWILFRDSDLNDAGYLKYCCLFLLVFITGVVLAIIRKGCNGILLDMPYYLGIEKTRNYRYCERFINLLK